MLENYLPLEIVRALNNISYKNLCELRLRCDDYIIVNLDGYNYYLGSSSFSSLKEDALVIDRSCINYIMQKISNDSMYTINDDLKSGYVTLPGGVRIGVCGEIVMVDGKISTIKNISSLNFRFPHFIKNCSLNIYNYICSNGKIRNTLIISPPGGGKTTYLRDLIYQISNRNNFLNLLVVDERDEIASIYNGNSVDKFLGIDVYSKCSKKIGFINGIRSMRPDVIFTDEINLDNDIGVIEDALTSGVCVIATLHAKNTVDLKNKNSFKEILNKNLFERYVFLSNKSGVGTLDGVFDENLIFIGV